MHGWETECEEGLVGAYYVGAGVNCARREGRGLKRVADKLQRCVRYGGQLLFGLIWGEGKPEVWARYV